MPCLDILVHQLFRYLFRDSEFTYCPLTCNSVYYFSYFPRDHSHTECGEGEHATCLTNEGVCTQNVAVMNIMHDANNIGTGRLTEWTPVPMSFVKSCSCEVITGSVLKLFI